jgi:hypothetical protein
MTKPSFGEAFRLWAKLGLINFGGPAAQIAMMHRMVVDERRWIGETRFLHALNFCTLLPGPVNLPRYRALNLARPPIRSLAQGDGGMVRRISAVSSCAPRGCARAYSLAVVVIPAPDATGSVEGGGIQGSRDRGQMWSGSGLCNKKAAACAAALLRKELGEARGP